MISTIHNNILKNIKAFSLATLLALSGCSSDSDDEIDDFLSEGNLLSFTFNGDDRASLDEATAAAIFEIPFGETIQFGFTLGAASGDLSGNSWVLTIALSEPSNTQFIQEGITVTNNDLGEELFFSTTYTENINAEESLDASYEEGLFFSLTISSIDNENQTVSGTFSCDLMDEDSNQVFQIRNGRFTNVPFSDSDDN